MRGEVGAILFIQFKTNLGLSSCSEATAAATVNNEQVGR